MWLATILQLPAATKVTFVVNTVHTFGVVEAKTTPANNGVVVAVKASGEVLNAFAVIAAKLIARFALFTVKVKLCVAAGVAPVATMLKGNTPAAVGVPASTPAAVSVTPPGMVLAVAKVGTGKPVAVTLNVPATANVNVTLAALVNAGGTGVGDGVTATTAEAALLPTAFLATTEHE